MLTAVYPNHLSGNKQDGVALTTRAWSVWSRQ